MRSATVLLVLALALPACGGGDGGGDTTAFCDLMQRFQEIAESALDAEDPTAIDFEALTSEIETIITEAEEAAPEEIADIIDSADEADQQRITEFVSEECGIELPDV